MKRKVVFIENLLLVLVASIILIACSKLKHVYYFNPTKSTALVKRINRYDAAGVSITKANHSLLQVQKETLAASISSEPAVLPNNSIPVINKVERASQTLQVSKKAGLMKNLGVIKKMNAEHASTVGDKTKNASAIAGFIFSVTSVVATLFLFSTSGYLILFFVVGIGVTLSAIGLKSEKRGLAKAGLWIGIAGLILAGLVAIFNSGLLGGYD